MNADLSDCTNLLSIHISVYIAHLCLQVVYGFHWALSIVIIVIPYPLSGNFNMHVIALRLAICLALSLHCCFLPFGMLLHLGGFSCVLFQRESLCGVALLFVICCH